MGGDTEETQISALTLDGLATGWPISVAGWASVPSFGTDGRIYVTAGRWPVDDEGRITPRASSQVYAFTRDGRLATGWPVQLPIDTTLPASDVASPPLPPVVAPDGSVYVVAGPGAATVAYALGPSGQLRAGWPFRSQDDLVVNVGGACTTCPSCPSFYLPPFAGPDGSLHLAQNTEGGVRATAPTESRRSGQPARSRRAGLSRSSRPGRGFATSEVGADGTPSTGSQSSPPARGAPSAARSSLSSRGPSWRSTRTATRSTRPRSSCRRSESRTAQ